MFLRSLLFSFFVAVLAVGPVAPVLAQDCDARKAATAPMSRFKVSSPGTITDSKNKLVWLRCPLGMEWSENSCAGKILGYTWREAVIVADEANSKKVMGRNDWRLPTIDELNTIVERRCFKPAIDLAVFPYSPESGFWTDTSVKGVQPRVWLVHFLNGNQYIANKKQAWRVRLVADK